MQKKLTMAFDVEGTLLDKTGKLDLDVIDIFKKADKRQTTFILLTGGSLSVAQDALRQINERIGGAPIKAWIGANGGGLIYSPDGQKVKNEYFSESDIDNALSYARALDKKCIAMYATEKGNFVDCPDSIANKVAMYFFKKHDAKKGSAGMKLQDIDISSFKSIDDLTDEIGNINEMYFFTLSKDKKAEIHSKLSLAFNDECSIYCDKYISIPAMNKWFALKEIQKLDENLPQDVRDIIYFGDGENDVACLKWCNLSVARGEQATITAKNSAKRQLNNLSAFADEIYGISEEKNKSFERVKQCLQANN